MDNLLNQLKEYKNSLETLTYKDKIMITQVVNLCDELKIGTAKERAKILENIDIYKQKYINYENSVVEKEINKNKEFINFIIEQCNNNLNYSLYMGEAKPIQQIYDRSEIKKEIFDFYRILDYLKLPYVKDICNHHLYFKKCPLGNRQIMLNGSSCMLGSTPIVYVEIGSSKTNKNFGVNNVSTIIHEIAHSIDFTYGNYLKKCDSVFCEVLSNTSELSYLKTRDEHKEDIIKVIYSIYSDLDVNLSILPTDKKDPDYLLDTLNTYSYIVGITISFYLSDLFMNNRYQFNQLYELIKKCSGTRAQDKIISELTQNKEFMSFDFLKRNIDDNQKLLKIYNFI